jgi:hypothetical protein
MARADQATQIFVFVTVAQILCASPCCRARNAAVLAAVSPEVGSNVSC